MVTDGVTRQVLTIKLRIRDKHVARLNAQARAVNLVWNYCNEIQQKTARSGRKWLSGYDLIGLTSGASEELNLHSHTIQRVCLEYDKARRQHRKPWLRWRGRKSLGWVPFNTGHVTFNGETFRFRGIHYETMHLRDVLDAGVKIGAGSFNADARGRWYINIPVEVKCSNVASIKKVGIDLGLKDLATCSDGHKIAMPAFARKASTSLAKAQRARKKRLARALHAKVRNQRKDYLHKASTVLTKEHGLIIVGDVSPSKLAKTRMAKSVLDAGWADLKAMLSYKAITRGGMVLEISEVNSTQSCSMCGSLPPSRPRGIAGLRIREWCCDDCGTVHDRDVNAARNILRIGQNALTGGVSA
jgi:IS605 OrfB family transposase